MSTQTLLPQSAPTTAGPETSAAPAASSRPVGHPVTLLTLRLLASAALLTSAYLHLVLALEAGLGGPLFTLPQLFLGQAAAAAVAGGLLMVADRDLLWLPAVAVAVGSVLPLLASVYFPLPAIGPLPPINEPVWYGEKLLSLAAAGSVPVLWGLRRIAPPPPR